MADLAIPTSCDSLFDGLSELLRWSSREQSLIREELAAICAPLNRLESTANWPSALATELSARKFLPNGKAAGFDFLRLLSHRHGNCVEHSILWMLVGELCNVRLTAVRVPSHMFVRWWNGMGSPQNVEPMEPSVHLTNEQYATRYSLSQRQHDTTVYLSDLTIEEVLGEVVQKALYQDLFGGAPISRLNRKVIRWVLTSHRMPSDLYNSIGINLLSRRPAIARDWLQAAYEYDPDFIPIFNNYVHALVLTESYDEVISVCQAATDHVWSQNANALLDFTKSLLRTGRYAKMDMVFECVNLLWVNPGVRERFLPYEITHAHLIRDYQRAADLCLEWARIGTVSEIGFAWRESALHMMCKTDNRDLPILESEYVYDLVQMFRSQMSPDTLAAKHPDQKHLNKLYAGEYFLPYNPALALDYFSSAATSLKHTCFEHLRASRHLADCGVQ